MRRTKLVKKAYVSRNDFWSCANFHFDYIYNDRVEKGYQKKRTKVLQIFRSIYSLSQPVQCYDMVIFMALYNCVLDSNLSFPEILRHKLKNRIVIETDV